MTGEPTPDSLAGSEGKVPRFPDTGISGFPSRVSSAEPPWNGVTPPVQAELLDPSRSSAYRAPKPVSEREGDLLLMRRARSLWRMGTEALYHKPRTSIRRGTRRPTRIFSTSEEWLALKARQTTYSRREICLNSGAPSVSAARQQFRPLTSLPHQGRHRNNLAIHNRRA